MKEFQLCRNLTGEVLSTVIPRSYIDHLKEGTMNSGTVKDVRTIDLTDDDDDDDDDEDDDDDDDDTSGNQNGNMEWKNETIFHFQHFQTPERHQLSRTARSSQVKLLEVEDRFVHPFHISILITTGIIIR